MKKPENKLEAQPEMEWNAELEQYPEPGKLAELAMNEKVIFRILELCRDRGYSLALLATKSHVPLTTLKNILNGASKNPGIVTIAKLCQGLRIDLAGFFAGQQFKNK